MKQKNGRQLMRLAPIFYSGLVAGLAGATAISCTLGFEPTGDLAVEVFLPDDVPIAALAYEVAGNGMPPLVHTAVLRGAPTTNSALFIGIPVGRDYAVSITATSVDGLVRCRSSGLADVLPHRTTSVSIPLACSKVKDGSVHVTVEFGCRLASLLVAAPSVTSVGGTIDARVVLAPQDGGAATFSWSATSGRFSQPDGPQTLFTCTQPGTAVLTIAVHTAACVDRLSVTVTCVGP